MTFTFRPAVREATPLIIGLAGPTKSGKTLSAHRLAAGLADGGVVAMLNAEGARGHQYADKFKYVACDIEAPFSPARYTEALLAAKELNPAVLICDSISHMHDGPMGLLEMHDAELDRMAGDDWKKRERMTWAAWIRPKKDENEFIYTMLGLRCPIVLCMRAKEKIKIVPGKPPVDLGWQPITSDRIAFETIFTLVLPPHCKGVPDLSISEMREPFDSMVPEGKQIDEDLGRKLAAWARGSALKISVTATSTAPETTSPMYITAREAADLEAYCSERNIPVKGMLTAAKVDSIDRLPDFARAKAWVDKQVAARKDAEAFGAGTRG